MLPLLKADLPTDLLSRLSCQLKAFLTTVPSAHKSAAHLIQRVWLNIKDRLLTRTLEDLVGVHSPPAVSSPNPEPVSLPVSVPKPIKIHPADPEPKTPAESSKNPDDQNDNPPIPCTSSEPCLALKDDDSTCSVEISSTDPQLEDLSEPNEPVVFPESEEFVADRDKRRHVCLTVYRILQSNGFAMKEAKLFALRIESRLRRRDPSMGELYATQYKKMIRDMRRLQPEALVCA